MPLTYNRGPASTLFFLMATLAVFAACANTAESTLDRPGNITVVLVSPESVRVVWTSSGQGAERFDVVHKPSAASFRVVSPAAANARSLTLDTLAPDTQYQVYVAAVGNRERARSRTVVFRTMDPPSASTPPPSPNPGAHQGSTKGGPGGLLKVRGVEATIVVVVLAVWAGAILLFFNRWGKIRMLLPYQPDYKEQHKANCPLAANAHSVAPAAFAQHHVCGASGHLDFNGSPSRSRAILVSQSPIHRQQRPRINSVFIFDNVPRSPDVRVQRKFRSAEQLDVTPRDEQREFLFADV